MKTPDRIQRQAHKLLGHPVRLVFDDDDEAVCGWLIADDEARWLTATEWRILFRNGLVEHKKMLPAPERGDHEDECPCPGCGRCACPWVDGGSASCGRKPCACPRTRRPVRLRLRWVSFRRLALELRRGDHVLASLGEWTPLRGWDFSRAGAAKARSLPAIVEAVVAREKRRWNEGNELQAELDELQAGLVVSSTEDLDEPVVDLELPAGLDLAAVAGFSGAT